VSCEFIKLLSDKYSVPKEMLHCPVVDEDTAAELYDKYSSTTFRMIGYMVWIPRLNGSALVPPVKTGDAGYSATAYPLPLVPGPIAGPRRLADPMASTVPIFTDVAVTAATVTPPSDARINSAYPLDGNSGHRWRGRVENSNQAFADGHVESVNGDELRPRYNGNVWNWR
jgi:prepilin-type processing-associated H-X9-DG protein